jgi:hypothetical protein
MALAGLDLLPSSQNAWEAITALCSAAQPEAAFVPWIEKLRTDGSLRNDDVTLLVVQSGILQKE